MGARIAAHIANAGYNCSLLDRRLNDANTPDLASDAIRTLRNLVQQPRIFLLFWTGSNLELLRMIFH